jgi:hypothetical protein
MKLMLIAHHGRFFLIRALPLPPLVIL